MPLQLSAILLHVLHVEEEKYPIIADTNNPYVVADCEQGYITTGYEMFGHRDGVCTDCPGDNLYIEIQSWPHYSYRQIPVNC